MASIKYELLKEQGLNPKETVQDDINNKFLMPFPLFAIPLNMGTSAWFVTII